MKITPRIDFDPKKLLFSVDGIPFMSAEAISSIKDELDAEKYIVFRKSPDSKLYRSYNENELLTLLQNKLK